MAPGLNLPPPSESVKQARVEDVDDEPTVAAAGITAAGVPSTSVDRFTTGNVILPPPDVRTIIRKTASFISRVGPTFEERLRSEDNSGKLAFLNPNDPFYPYYRQTLEELSNGAVSTNTAEPQNESVGGNIQTEKLEEHDDLPVAPAPYQFSAELPSITALDLDIMKLTALFTAIRGRSVTNEILLKKGKTFQFEFLRPFHSLFPFFNKLVEQYQIVVDARGVTPDELGKEMLIGTGRGGLRHQLLTTARDRTLWERHIKNTRRQKEEEDAAMRAAFDEIDWHDFVVVQSVELTENDYHVDLPLPTSIRDIENTSLAQKKLAAMIMDSSEAPSYNGQQDPASNEGDTIDTEDEQKTHEEAAPLPLSLQSKASVGEIKIRTNYTPKVLGKRPQSDATTTCPVCGQQIPLKEMEEHVRFELLNPQYREQRRQLDARQAQHTALQSGADPVNALRRYAGARTDIFGAESDEQARRLREEEEQRLQRERERLAYDGHLASRTAIQDKVLKAGNTEEAARAREEASRKAQSNPVIGPQFAHLPTPEDSRKRPAEEAAAGEPSAQRVAVEPAFASTAFPGEEGTNEITLSLQLPDAVSTSPQCDGRVISLPPMSLDSTIANVRDYVQTTALQNAIGASRLKFKIGGKATTLKQTLRSWSLTNGSVLDLQIQK